MTENQDYFLPPLVISNKTGYIYHLRVLIYGDFYSILYCFPGEVAIEASGSDFRKLSKKVYDKLIKLDYTIGGIK